MSCLPSFPLLTTPCHACREILKEPKLLDNLLSPAAHGTSGGGGGEGGGTDAGPLVPELAQLQWLLSIDIVFRSHGIAAAIPAEWGQPGAFPHLIRCGPACAAAGWLLLDGCCWMAAGWRRLRLLRQTTAE